MTDAVLYNRDYSFANETGFVARLKKRDADYRLYRRTLNELRALDTRDLNDLGLSRFGLKAVAWESVYGA